jgi:hypothetical protein
VGIVLLIVALVVAAGGGAAIALASSSKRKYARQGQIVPGVESKAPASWAGAHTPEAKLHRRLGNAVAAVRANAAVDAFSSARTTFEAEALALDERLVAAAALPESVRAEPMAKVAAAVDALEAAAGALALQQAHGDPAVLAGAVNDVDERMRALAEARAELDRADPAPPA